MGALARDRVVDFESPSLRRSLLRFARDAPLELTEMLPAPEQCWLASDAGHHTSELRVVALQREP